MCLCLLLLTGCTEDTTDRSSVSQDEPSLLGTWETVDYEVIYPTHGGSDTTWSNKITEAEWGQKYGVQPPSTLFTDDGKLRRTHRMRDGTVANVVNGLWKTEGDSIFIIEPNVTYTFARELSGDRLTLSGTVDHDRDGERDDRFRAVYRLTGRTR